MATIKQASFIITALCSFIVVSLWALDRKKREQVFVVTYGLVVTVAFIFLSASSGAKQLCLNNANEIDANHGFSLCRVEGFVLTYISFFCALCFAMQSMDIFRIVVLKSKSPQPKPLYTTIVLLVPLVGAISCLLTRRFGVDSVNRLCEYEADTPLRIGLYVGPVALTLLVGLILCGALTVKLVVLGITPVERGGVGARDGVVMAGTSLKFLVFSGCYLCSVLIIRVLLANSESYSDRAVEWGRCALEYFDGTVDSYAPHCGYHAPRFIDFPTSCFIVVLVFAGFGLFFVVVNVEGLWALLKRRLCDVAIDPINDYIELVPSTQSRVGNSQADRVHAELYDRRQWGLIPSFVGSGMSPPALTRQVSSLGASIMESQPPVEVDGSQHSPVRMKPVPSMSRQVSALGPGTNVAESQSDVSYSMTPQHSFHGNSFTSKARSFREFNL